MKHATQNGAKIELTDNQAKVIRDKYLRDAPSVEAWLSGVARNIALAELLFHPDRAGWGVFDGVQKAEVDAAAPSGTAAARMVLLHEGVADATQRDRNFRRLLDNLESACARHQAARSLVEGWAQRFLRLMASWDFLPNSPTLMNAGRELQQLSACYVLPVPDSMEAITKSLAAQSLIQKSGGGTGFAFSRLRPKGDLVRKTQGVASGALSFMQLFDKLTDVVKQGGARRGANMGILHYTHPEIRDFITLKAQPGVMENFNVSVAIDDRFMQAVAADAEYDLINPRDQRPVGKARAKEIFDLMVDYAWKSGDPGFIVADRINASGSNPTPALGQIESTNPCFAGDVRLATERGLLTFEELHLEQTPIAVVTDDRVPLLQALASGGRNLSAAARLRTGVTLRQAVPVFKTRTNWPTFRLETERGYEVAATADHRFFTPSGPRELKDLRPGDELFLQSGAGVWSQDDTLPPLEPDNKFRARILRGQARPPRKWSRELGQLLGWVIGGGWVSEETPLGREAPDHAIGLMFGGDEKKLLAPKFRCLINEWTGEEGRAVERGKALTLSFRSSLHHLLRSLGVKQRDGLAKELPTALWQAPREAVIGFLSALFTADKTVNLPEHKGSRSIRLANSSRRFLQQVQALLLNEGIVSRLHSRRQACEKLTPSFRRNPKPYRCAPHYELILDGSNRDRFLTGIGFCTPAKQAKAVGWVSSKKRGSNAETFVDRVRSVEPAGTQDVYCTTEPQTHSLIANGLVAANCGEQPLLPWEPCNLGSINLSRFVEGGIGRGALDERRLAETVALAVRFLDDVIEVNNYPLPEIERLAKGNRRIGLGVMGYAEALVKMGLAYDSPAALQFAEKTMRLINEEALKASEALAVERGVFPNWKNSIYDPDGPHYRGADRRPRHCARTTIAPTGTIAIAAGLQGSGIEPFFAIAYTRYNAKALDALRKGETPAAKDVFFEVNALFRELAKRHGFFGLSEQELWARVDANHKAVRGLKEVPEAVQRLFPTAHDVPVEVHVRAQAAFQAHTDNGVSKTINLPSSATLDDVRSAYQLAYQLGCKGITIYRDGSKAQQVLNLAPAPTKMKRPEPTLALGVSSEYYLIKTGYGPLHVHINYDERGPYQVFANLPPLGTEISALTSLVGILLSKYLAEGGDPVRILKHLNSVKGDKPVGFGDQRVNSVAHAISIALRQHLKKTGWISDDEDQAQKDGLELLLAPKAEFCPKCYSSNIAHESGCSGPTCHDCGYSECS